MLQHVTIYCYKVFIIIAIQLIGYCNNVEQEKSKNVEQENGLWHMGYLNYGASQGQGLGNGL